MNINLYPIFISEQVKHRKYIHCYLAAEDKKIISHGISRCAPTDQHNKKIGKEIALGRAKHAVNNLLENKNVTKLPKKLEGVEYEVDPTGLKQLHPILQSILPKIKLSHPISFTIDEQNKYFKN